MARSTTSCFVRMPPGMARSTTSCFVRIPPGMARLSISIVLAMGVLMTELVKRPRRGSKAMAIDFIVTAELDPKVIERVIEKVDWSK